LWFVRPRRSEEQAGIPVPGGAATWPVVFEQKTGNAKEDLMTAPAQPRAIAFLRRAGLLAAVLSVIAGIFGMHVLTATHAAHSPATAAANAHHDSPAAGHPGDHLPGPVLAADEPEMHDLAAIRAVQCADPGACTGRHVMTGFCTPSAKTGSLTAPLPGTAIIAGISDAGARAAISARWSYRPAGPSPGELCISRT
jgi:hypothetical protein